MKNKIDIEFNHDKFTAFCGFNYGKKIYASKLQECETIEEMLIKSKALIKQIENTINYLKEGVKNEKK